MSLDSLLKTLPIITLAVLLLALKYKRTFCSVLILLMSFWFCFVSQFN